MNWYYALGGQQKGPVSDMEFTTLVRDGVILPKTLVWREGQPEWQALEKARPDLMVVSNAPVIGGVAVPEENKDVLVQQLREGAVIGVGATGSATDLPYAGFWIRVGAKLIDWVVLTIFMVIVALIGVMGLGVGAEFFESLSSGRMENDPEVAMAMAMFQLGFMVVIWGAVVAYNAVMVAMWGGTLGKLAVGIRVVTADGGKVTFGRAVGRAFADLISYAVCQLLYLMVAFDEPQKRALHDHICATRVVRK
ncbi:RDD family protein [Phragmitibacter flavus]|nr:RDD family protein [Phragmitibacter flavus]